MKMQTQLNFVYTINDNTITVDVKKNLIYALCYDE